MKYALWWGYKGQDYRNQEDIQSIDGALLIKTILYLFHVSFGSVHLLDKVVAQIVLWVYIFKIPQYKCMEL